MRHEVQVTSSVTDLVSDGARIHTQAVGLSEAMLFSVSEALK